MNIRSDQFIKLNKEIHTLLNDPQIQKNLTVEKLSRPCDNTHAFIFTFNESIKAQKIVKIFDYLTNTYGDIITKLKLKSKNKIVFYVTSC